MLVAGISVELWIVLVLAAIAVVSLYIWNGQGARDDSYGTVETRHLEGPGRADPHQTEEPSAQDGGWFFSTDSGGDGGSSGGSADGGGSSGGGSE